MAHSLKSIKYLNKEKHILLQNENGPCPLLAAANALILQSQIEFPPAVIRSNVASIDQVINLLAEHCFSKTENKNEGSQHHMDELMQLFPSLQYGMDVNPKFTIGVNGVEYNSGLSAFDLMGVELVHGWLVDVEDSLNGNAIQEKSYNELVELIIKGKDANVKIAELEAKVKELESVSRVIDESSQANESREKDSLQDAMANVSIDEESSNKDQSTVDTPTLSPLQKSDLEGELSMLKQEVEKQTKMFQNGHIVEEFLSNTSTQLTHTGLIELHNHIQPNKFYVFFRNNHFCTITKHDDSLFLLVTDLGYANVPEVVWEKLDDISGDTEYFNSEFVKSPPLSQMTATGPSLSPEQLLAQSSAAERDYQLALQLSKNENDIDAQEGKLIAAATEASLQAYNVEQNCVGLDGHTSDNSSLQQETSHSEALLQQAREEEDRLVAMQLQNQYEQEASQEQARREQQMEQERLHQQHIRQQQQQRQHGTRGTRHAKNKDDGCIVS